MFFYGSVELHECWCEKSGVSKYTSYVLLLPFTIKVLKMSAPTGFIFPFPIEFPPYWMFSGRSCPSCEFLSTCSSPHLSLPSPLPLGYPLLLWFSSCKLVEDFPICLQLSSVSWAPASLSSPHWISLSMVGITREILKQNCGAFILQCQSLPRAHEAGVYLSI